ncbi:MAG TPA: hypothetical protein VHW45_14790 [Candidatus Sulfotelmatobacter sp.]|jgi:hypothetical protein|nr:hypothetical protein [Candidatus Sulfotelmatobacter sp.]
MDEKLHQKIVQAVHAEYGWKTEEVAVDEVEDLRRPSCSFYTARSTVRPLSYLANYAVLKANELVGIGDENAVTKILDACSNDGSADWWAEIITRFHQDVGGGLVLGNESERPDVVRRLAQDGKTFTPPTLDDAKRSVSFLLLDAEAYVVYSVKATRMSSGGMEVVKTKLLGNPSNAKPSVRETPADARKKMHQALR